jgi:hypothetical protein
VSRARRLLRASAVARAGRGAVVADGVARSKQRLARQAHERTFPRSREAPLVVLDHRAGQIVTGDLGSRANSSELMLVGFVSAGV